MTPPDPEPPTAVEQPTRWWEATSPSSGAVDAVVATHERFARQAGFRLGQLVRADVDVALRTVGWTSFGSVLDDSDGPAVFVEVDLPGAPTAMLFRFDAALALRMIDRTLGGSGATASVRPPTELELELVGDLATGPVHVVGEALTDLLTAAPRILRIDVDPRLVRLVASRERTLVLRYGVTVDLATPVEATVALCYPEATAVALVSRFGGHADGGPAGRPAAVNPVVRRLVGDVEVDVVARLRPSQVPADDLRRLREGDVLTLDHRRDDAVDLAIGDLVVLQGALGRRRRNVAVRVHGWSVPPPTGTQEQAISAAAEPGSRVRASVSEPAGGDLPEALDTSAAADTPGDGGDGSDQPSVTPAELSELGGGSPPGPAAGLDLLRDVELTVTVEVGRARTRVRDLLGLREGSVVELDRQVGSPVDLLVNGRVIARGEIVLVADQLGVRVTGLRPEGDDG